MEKRLIEIVDNKVKEVLDSDVNANNIEYLYKLYKIRHMAKEDEQMNYNGYNGYNGYNAYNNYNDYNGRRAGFNSYGENYGRRGQDTKYRGYEQLDRMYNNYGRYEEDRERYGHNEDTKRSLQYMLQSMEDFARMLREDATSQEEVEMIRQTAQRIAQM